MKEGTGKPPREKKKKKKKRKDSLLIIPSFVIGQRSILIRNTQPFSISFFPGKNSMLQKKKKEEKKEERRGKKIVKRKKWQRVSTAGFRVTMTL